MKQNLCQMEKALKEALQTPFQIACAVRTLLNLQECRGIDLIQRSQPACLLLFVLLCSQCSTSHCGGAAQSKLIR